jgi:hypothetical protein
LLESLSGSALESDTLTLRSYDKTLYIKRADTLNIVGADPRGCAPYQNIIETVIVPTQLTIDGATIDVAKLRSADALSYDDQSVMSMQDCVLISTTY